MGGISAVVYRGNLSRRGGYFQVIFMDIIINLHGSSVLLLANQLLVRLVYFHFLK